MKFRMKSLVCLLCAAAMILTACGGAPAASSEASKAAPSVTADAWKKPSSSSAAPASSASASASAAPAKPKKDIIIYANASEPKGMDPANSIQESVTAAVILTVQECLLEEKVDDSTVLEPRLCESYKISDDGLEITFTLRKGVKFHSGEPMTAEDVAFSFNRAIENSKFTSSVTSTMKNMEVVDDTHVKLIMKSAYLPVLQSVANHAMAIVSKKYIQEAEAKGIDLLRNPIGTGKYKFKSWESGSMIEFEKFDDYWGEPAAVKTLQYKVMPDKTTAAIALEMNEIDAYAPPNYSDLKHLDELPNVDVDDVPGAGIVHVFFNLNAPDKFGPMFRDQKVRQAIAHAINREETLLAGTDGFGVVNECMLAPSLAGYDPNAKFWPYDLEKAKALLAEAGYKDGFEQTAYAGQAAYAKALEAVQAQLREVGIKVEVELQEKATYDSVVRGEMQYGMSLHNANGFILDADFVLWRRFTSYNMGNNQNITGVNSPEIDKLLDDAKVCLDQAERDKMYSKLYEYNKEVCAYIPLYSPLEYIAYNADLKNCYSHPISRHAIHRLAW